MVRRLVRIPELPSLSKDDLQCLTVSAMADAQSLAATERPLHLSPTDELWCNKKWFCMDSRLRFGPAVKVVHHRAHWPR